MSQPEKPIIAPRAGASDMPYLDLVADEYITNPHVTHHGLRDQGGIARNDFGYSVLGYADTLDVLRRPAAESKAMDMEFVTLRAHFASADPDERVTEGPIQRFFAEVVGPWTSVGSHGPLRRVSTSAFTASAVRRWQDQMGAIAADLAESFAPDGRVEFVEQFAGLYPPRVFALMAGLPDEDIPIFTQWSTDVGLCLHRPLAPVRKRAETAVEGLFGYVAEIVEQRRKDPGDDLISRMVLAAEDEDELTMDEITGSVLLLIFASHETIASQLSLIVNELAQHPDVWARLAEEPESARRVVDEGMRLHSTVNDFGRTMLEDIAVAGMAVPAGTHLFCPVASANRDPEMFPDPDRFDPGRANSSRHLTFGNGRHVCLGSNVARAEMSEALVALARRMPNLRVVQFEEMGGRPQTRRVTRLELEFDVT